MTPTRDRQIMTSTRDRQILKKNIGTRPYDCVCMLNEY